MHRIGRVGRAGAPGWSWALVSDADKRRLSKIEKLLGKTLSSRPIPSLIAEEHREQSDDDLVRARSGRGAGSDLRPGGRGGPKGADRGPRGRDRGPSGSGDRRPRDNQGGPRKDRGPRPDRRDDGFGPRGSRADRGERKSRSSDRPGRPDRGAQGSKGPGRSNNRRGQNPSAPRGGPRGRRS